MQSDFAVTIERRSVKNFWKGRGGFLPIAIVERMIQGSIEDAEQYFNGRSPEGVFAVSAHYGIARDGRVWQFVADEDTAWSNGVLQNPDLSIDWLKEVYQEKVNCNLVTLSIDYEGYSGEPLTPRQYESALALHRQLIERWDIEVDNHHIIGHNWIDSLERSHNPGPLFPFNQLIKDLKAAPEAAAAQPVQNNPLTFLETPLAGAEPETESAPQQSAEPENVAAYQPETVEEPAYRPQVEAFTFTPEMNEEVDQVTDVPTEVDSATAEPEQVQAETFQDTAAYQPEEVDHDTGYQPEEVKHETPYEPETFQTASQVEDEQFGNRTDAAYRPELLGTEAYNQPEEVENEATTQPDTDLSDLAPQEAAYTPVAVHPEMPYESAPVENEAAAGTAVVESEAAAQPEAAEEPAYEPEPVAAIEQTGEAVPEDQTGTAYQPEEVQTASPPEEAYQPEEVEQDTGYQPEEVQTAASDQSEEAPAEESPVESAQSADRLEEAPAEEVQPESEAVQTEEPAQEPAYQTEVFEPEQAGTADQSDVAYEFEALEREAANLPIQGEEITKPGAVPPEEAPAEPASPPEEVQAVDQSQGQPVDQSATQSESATETAPVEPAEAQPEPAFASEPAQSTGPEPEAQTDDAYTSELADAVSRAELDQNEADRQAELDQHETDRQAEAFDIETDLSYITNDARSAVTKPLVMPDPALQPEAAQSAEVASEQGQPEAAARPEEPQPDFEPAPYSEEAQSEALEPEAVETEPAFEADSQPEAQPEVFDAPRQPESLDQIETAAFEPAEPAVIEQTAPAQTALEQTAPDGAGEALPEQAAPEPTLEDAAEPGQVAPETVAPEPAVHVQDDWAAGIFAEEPVPGFTRDTAPATPEPSVRDEKAITGQLEVSPVIGDDITPKYFRPEFFDPTHSSEPTPVEVFEAPAAGETAEATEAAPVEEEAAAAVPESQPETPEPLSEEASAAELMEEAAPEAPTGEVAAAPASEETPAGDAAYQPPSAEISEAAEPVFQTAESETVSLNPVEVVEAQTAPSEAAPVETPAALPSQTEVPAQPASAEPAARVEPEKPEEKHHWYDGIKKLFGGHDEKQAQGTPEAIPAQPVPSPEIIQAAPFNQVESVAPEGVEAALPVETGPLPAAEAPQVYITEPAAYQPDYAAEQAIFRSESDAAPGTIEAAAEAAAAPARFDAGPTAPAGAEPALEPAQAGFAAESTQPETEASREDYAAEPAQPETEPAPDAAPDTFETAPVTGAAAAPASEPEVQPESAIEAVPEPDQPEAARTQDAPVNPPVELPKVEESFYPFELDTPSVSNYDNYYRSGTTDELAAQSSNYDFGLESPAPTYSQDYRTSGPSDYPFELPTRDTTPGYLQSFAPTAPPVEEPAQPEAPLVTPEPAQTAELAQPVVETRADEPPAFEPAQSTGIDQNEAAAHPVIPPFSFEPERPGDVLFDTNSASSGHPKFAYDDLELPDWLNEPEAPEAAGQPANPGTGVTAPPEAVTPSTTDFAWAGGTAAQESALPGWLQESNEEPGVPEWLQDVTEPVNPVQPASPQAAQPPAFKDTPAREIPNKDWQDNENLFEDDDFFSLLNQSGLDLSLERGGTGALPSTGALPANPAPSPTPPSNEAVPAAPPPPEPPNAARPQPAPPASPGPEFDNIFDEVEPPPPPAKMTVRQLIDRNDGYTAPLSYEDLDMSVPFGLEEDETLSGLAPAPAPASQPVPADPPGFNRVALGGGQTSVELANIRSTPSYDKNTVVRVSEQGERFEFDGWMVGPELRGSTRWYHIASSSGDHWIHSSLVQLDRPFRG